MALTMKNVEEVNRRLQKIVQQVKQENYQLGLPKYSRNDLCISPGHYIATYPNGNVELVKINLVTGKMDKIMNL